MLSGHKLCCFRMESCALRFSETLSLSRVSQIVRLTARGGSSRVIMDPGGEDATCCRTVWSWRSEANVREWSLTGEPFARPRLLFKFVVRNPSAFGTNVCQKQGSLSTRSSLSWSKRGRFFHSAMSFLHRKAQKKTWNSFRYGVYQGSLRRGSSTCSQRRAQASKAVSPRLPSNPNSSAGTQMCHYVLGAPSL